ncbi:MAG TPA: S-adenosylmethionine decarboxylase [Candidatus Obscuribacterales bacterium]
MKDHTPTNAQMVMDTPTKLTSHHFSAILTTINGRENDSCQDLLSLLKEAIAEARLTAVAEVTARFQPHGVSAVVVLEESHVAVHLWPEHKAATVDIHVCDYSQGNEARAMELARLIGWRLAGDDSLASWSRLTVSSP